MRMSYHSDLFGGDEMRCWRRRGSGGGMVIELEERGVSLNVWERLHWGHKKRKVRAWAWWFAAAVGELRMEGVVSREVFARVRIRYYFRVTRARDRDNYAPKGLLDGLRKGGVVVDDSERWLDVDWEIVNGAGKDAVQIEVVYEVGKE